MRTPSEDSRQARDEEVVPLVAEQVEVARRRVPTGRVRVSTSTRIEEREVDELLTSEHADVTRVPVGREVSEPPQVRQEGDTVIVPVVEEIVVVERRLMLREELHIRRVRTQTRHRETVPVRTQDVNVQRTSPEAPEPAAPAPDLPVPRNRGERSMARETIVAVFDNPQHAHLAVQELRSAGIDNDDIEMHDQSTMQQHQQQHATGKKQGFWSRLFGRDDDDTEGDIHTDVFDRSFQSGSVVVTVKADEDEAQQACAILERHNPIDLDERAEQWGYGQQPETVIEADLRQDRGQMQMAADTPVQTGQRQMQADMGQQEVIPLAEENIAIGKRAVNLGTTRIRRYVVERPIEENVTLREEHVEVERHPVQGAANVPPDSFTDRTLEVTETAEEAVVGKTARVAEEVVIRKGQTERTETIRDTVRKEEIDVERVPGTETGRTSRGRGTPRT